jgi:hypothetical protein
MQFPPGDDAGMKQERDEDDKNFDGYEQRTFHMAIGIRLFLIGPICSCNNAFLVRWSDNFVLCPSLRYHLITTAGKERQPYENAEKVDGNGIPAGSQCSSLFQILLSSLLIFGKTSIPFSVWTTVGLGWFCRESFCREVGLKITPRISLGNFVCVKRDWGQIVLRVFPFPFVCFLASWIHAEAPTVRNAGNSSVKKEISRIYLKTEIQKKNEY